MARQLHAESTPASACASYTGAGNVDGPAGSVGRLAFACGNVHVFSMRPHAAWRMALKDARTLLQPLIWLLQPAQCFALFVWRSQPASQRACMHASPCTARCIMAAYDVMRMSMQRADSLHMYVLQSAHGGRCGCAPTARAALPILFLLDLMHHTSPRPFLAPRPAEEAWLGMPSLGFIGSMHAWDAAACCRMLPPATACCMLLYCKLPLPTV